MDISARIFNIVKSMKNSKLVKIDDTCILIEDADCNVKFMVNLEENEIYQPVASKANGSNDVIEFVRDYNRERYIVVKFKSGYIKRIDYNNPLFKTPNIPI